MVVLIGILMIGGHFLLVTGIAQYCSQNFPEWGMPVFLLTAMSSGYFMLKMQTRLEAYFIGRHLKKKPDSGWNVVTAGKQTSRKSKPRKDRRAQVKHQAGSDTNWPDFANV